jgi:DHA3 family macrolide efflux protein-like MFS transporter
VNIIAAPIAVLLLLVADLKILLWLDILSFGIAVVPLLKLHIPKNGKKLTDSTDSIDPQQVEESKKSSFFSEFKDGFKGIKEIPGMMQALIMATFLNFFFQPFDTLLINFVKFTHGGGIEEYGILTSCIRVGLFIGAIVVSIKKKWHHWVLYVGGGIISMGVVTLFIALVPIGNFGLLYLGAILLMMMNPIVNTLFQSLLQLKIPPEKMGRVFSIVITFASLMTPLGMIIAGPIADAVNSIQIVYIGSGILSIIAALVFIFQPKVIQLLKDGEKLSLAAHNESEMNESEAFVEQEID